MSGWLARSLVPFPEYENEKLVPVSRSNAAGSAERSATAAAKPSTRPLSPPSPAARRQCSSWTVGTGSRYGLSVCGSISRLVKARLPGAWSTRTSNSSP